MILSIRSSVFACLAMGMVLGGCDTPLQNLADVEEDGLPAEAGGGHIPAEAGGGHIPAEAGGGHIPAEAGGGHIPAEAGGGHIPAEAGGGGGLTPKQQAQNEALDEVRKKVESFCKGDPKTTTAWIPQASNTKNRKWTQNARDAVNAGVNALHSLSTASYNDALKALTDSYGLLKEIKGKPPSGNNVFTTLRKEIKGWKELLEKQQ